MEDLDKLLQLLSSGKMSKRHARLVTLLHKLREAMTNHNPAVQATHNLEKTHPLAITSSNVQDIRINRVSAA